MLGTPPAFVLSQDQTLNKWYLHSRSCLNLLLNSCILAYSRNFLSGACFAPYEALFLVLKSFLINTLFNLQGTHPRAAQGLYISTLASVCQEVFSTFFETLSRFAPSPERLINIPRTFLFVNTFFQFFLKYCEPPFPLL